MTSMAQPIISVVVEKLADFLLKQATEEIDLLRGVEREVQNLMSTLKSIQTVLVDAESKKITHQSVKAWLHELENLSYEIDDVLDEWNYTILKHEIEGIINGGDDDDEASTSINAARKRVCFLIPSSCFCFKRVVVRRDIALKIKELNRRLDLIDKRKNQFSFIITSMGTACNNSQEWKRVHSTSFIDASEVFGRMSDKDNLVSRLLSGSREEKKNATQILSIVGTGGIGKTTLAQLVYNDEQVKGYFEKRVWVCVSDPFDEIRVAKVIVQSLESSCPSVDEFDPLLNKVRDSILGKRTLFVFDDVWTEEQMKWEPFKSVLRFGAPRSTILLTTRSERVARVLGASVIPLGILSDLDSWSFFRQVAFFGRNETECERLESVGREIANKCKGLPLAIKTIGSLLRFKDTIEEWRKVMVSNMWELEAAEFDVFPHLYLSYHDLPSQGKRCFSYCAIFPKDKTIYIDELIRIWTAQGYLNSCGDEDEKEFKGREVFVNLAMRSLFQDFEKNFHGEIISCKMHDIVHDFTQFLTIRECLIIDGASKRKVHENVRHVTWLGNGEGSNESLSKWSMGLPRSFFGEYLKLQTLSPDLWNSLTLVRVLKLEQCGLQELPREIGNLIHLRYLHLCETELRELSKTIYDLYNLETLNLDDCFNLLELPPGIEKLKNLRHLTYRNKLPDGIQKMTCLRTLDRYSVGRGFNKLGYIKSLNQLHGRLTIEVKDNLDDAIGCEHADLKSKKHLKTLVFLFNDFRVKEDTMEVLEPPPYLQTLTISEYGGIRLPTWMITSLNSLTYLAFKACIRLRSLPPLGLLPSLEILHVHYLRELEFVDVSFLGVGDVHKSTWRSPAVAFPKLRELKFGYCKELRKWDDIDPECEFDATKIMPRLHQIIICKCPKLKALPHRLLCKMSSLEVIEVDGKKYNPCTILLTTLTVAEIRAGQAAPGDKT